MARRKVRLQYIQNDTARRVTYKKRVKGVLKKAQELSVLCGVDTVAIIYGPYDQAPKVHPPVETEARRILAEYKRKPELDQSQRRFNQQTFLKASVAKAEDRLIKMQRRNREIEIENLVIELLGGKPIEQVLFTDLGDLLWVIDDKLRTIQHRVGVLEGGNADPPSPNGDEVENAVVPVEEVVKGFDDVLVENPPWEMQNAIVPVGEAVNPLMQHAVASEPEEATPAASIEGKIEADCHSE